MDRKTTLTGAALAALALTAAGCAATGGGKGMAVAAGPKGECHGVNACKGKGECGGVAADGTSHECAGQNACKGQGWITLVRADCEKRGGTYKGK